MSGGNKTMWADAEAEPTDSPRVEQDQGRDEYQGHHEEHGSRGGAPRERESRDREPREKTPFPTQPPWRAYVGNLDFRVTEDDIYDFFGLEVNDIHVVIDRETGRSKGFAYVEFKDAEGLKVALEADGVDWNGRKVRMDVAESKNDRRGGGGRGGRGGGGDRGGGFRNDRGGGRGDRGDRGGDRREREVDEGGYNSRGFRQVKQNEVPEELDTKDRKKIVLAPRSQDPSSAPASAPAAAPASSSPKKNKPNPFGAARPREEVLAERKKLTPAEAAKEKEDAAAAAAAAPAKRGSDADERRGPRGGDDRGSRGGRGGSRGGARGGSGPRDGPRDGARGGSRGGSRGGRGGARGGSQDADRWEETGNRRGKGSAAPARKPQDDESEEVVADSNAFDALGDQAEEQDE